MTISSISVTAPVNIATLKYWGKRDKNLNLPTNSSISVTLSQDDLRTLTSVAVSPDFTEDKLTINGEFQSLDTPRSKACLSDLRKLRQELEAKNPELEKISNLKLNIVSENNFPTAAGLASSAAGFAALVYGVAQLYQLPQDLSQLSKIARKGSGSACRSLFGGFVAWEMGTEVDGNDSQAVEIEPLSHWPTMKAAILVVSDDKKDTPSTTGMQTTVQTSDLFKHRIEYTVPQRYEQMKQAIKTKNFPEFAKLTMQDSNSFHAVCLDSYPPIFYLNDTSKKIIKLVHQLNDTEGEIIAAYTFDAGPNAVIYYDEANESKVLGVLYKYFHQIPGWKGQWQTNHNFIVDENIHQGVSRIILTKIGEGPQITQTSLVDEFGLAKKS